MPLTSRRIVFYILMVLIALLVLIAPIWFAFGPVVHSATPIGRNLKLPTQSVAQLGRREAGAKRRVEHLARRPVGRKMPTMPDAQTTSDWLQGDWHLVDLSTDEQNIPQHRMDLRFAVRGKTIDGAILNRNTGDEIPLAAAAFDGAELRYQMTPPPGRTQAEMPWMVMRRVGGTLEGHWELTPGVAFGPPLKLVRARG